MTPSQPLSTRLHVLVLQHPREPHEALGSVALLPQLLQNLTIRVGLSWPNLKKALGREVNPTEWLVLYLGAKGEKREGMMQFFNRRNQPVAMPPRAKFQGIVVLDGTWKQAKSMWWRNPWLLKLQRASLFPQTVSLYGTKRREPRKDALSTLEAIALALEVLGEPQEVSETMRQVFSQFLASPQVPTAREP